MLKSISGLALINVPLNKGVNLSLPANHPVDKGFIRMRNFRVSQDGERVEKRLGSLNEITNFAEDVYGYATYWNTTPAFCQIAVLESQIKRDIAGAGWLTVHTFSSSISHPVKVLEIQGKQYIVTEVDSRFIDTDGTDYQIGIAAPTWLPFLYLTYPTTVLAEDCAVITDWVYKNPDEGAPGPFTSTGAGHVTQVAEDGLTCMKFNAPAAIGVARAYRQVGTELGWKESKRLKIELKVKIKNITAPDMFYFSYQYDDHHKVSFCTDTVHTCVGQDAPSRTSHIGGSIVLNGWYEFTFIVDGDNEWVDVYKGVGGVSALNYMGSFKGIQEYDSWKGETIALATSTGTLTDVYVDYINVYRTEKYDQVGLTYRYAVTYGRSGNYGNESNPIKSTIGTPAQVGAGLSDIHISTADSEFTGAVKRLMQVQVDSTGGSVDTIKVSYDGGYSFTEFLVPVPPDEGKIYLKYGVTIYFHASVGHTLGDYWNIKCISMSVTKHQDETTNFTDLPWSPDPQVDQRVIYRTEAAGADFYWLATISDNTADHTYSCSIPDAELGRSLEEDHDVLPNGKFACWWDDRLWVTGTNIVYYSALDNPEAFDVLDRMITVSQTEQDDELTGLASFKDALYVFKRNSIYVIMKKPDGTYGRYLINMGVGCVAPWSIIEANDLLMFLSHRGIELYNGTTFYSFNFSTPVQPDLDLVDTSKYQLVTSSHNRQHGEVWFNFPDVTGETYGLILVYNYLADAWSEFSMDKTISCLVECRNITKKLVNKYGTRDGYVRLSESGYVDGSALISSYFQTPWLTFPEYGDVVRVEMEYECPEGKTISSESYVNMQKDAAKEWTLYGESPEDTDTDIRKILYRAEDMNLRGRYFSYKLKNAENVGAALKVNKMLVFYNPRTTKKDISGD